jgi:aryl-alcohol dehydrogenase-like predicted oxidoreductase
VRFTTLGRTGLRVSRLAFGTASLGSDYGIPAPGGFGRPAEAEAIALVRRALEGGINLFDTAPTYGHSEPILGRALQHMPDCYITTKVSMPRAAGGSTVGARDAEDAIRRSLESSARTLHRETLDVVLMHNATADDLRQGMVMAALLAAKQRGLVRYIGASVYGEDNAEAVLEAGCFDVLQVAYNALDCRMASRILPAAEALRVGVMARSALLKGALTPKAMWLPDELAPVRAAVERLTARTGQSWEALPSLAVRFCLSASGVSTVLVGARTPAELDAALRAEAEGPLPGDLVESISAGEPAEERLVNPAMWPIA